MKGYSNKSIQIFLYFTILLLILLGLTILVIKDESIIQSVVLYGVVLCSIVIGIWWGSVASLAFSLLVIFIIGSYWFWKLWIIETADTPEFSIILIWMIAYIMTAVFSGIIHQIINSILIENEKLKSEYEELVSIDSSTGFYNQKRFLFELEQEFNRAKRYGHDLSLLCIRIAYLEQFKSLYGKKELHYLLQKISERIRSNVRLSDRLFRIEEDMIGILLTETPEDNIQTVIEKLEKELKNHTLSDLKRQVTLQFSYGYSSYSKKMDEFMEMFIDAEEGTKNYSE